MHIPEAEICASDNERGGRMGCETRAWLSNRAKQRGTCEKDFKCSIFSNKGRSRRIVSHELHEKIVSLGTLRCNILSSRPYAHAVFGECRRQKIVTPAKLQRENYTHEYRIAHEHDKWQWEQRTSYGSCLLYDKDSKRSGSSGAR